MSNFVTPPTVTEQVSQLGQRIRLARIRRGWSVADLAAKAGINRNTLHKKVQEVLKGVTDLPNEPELP